MILCIVNISTVPLVLPAIDTKKSIALCSPFALKSTHPKRTKSYVGMRQNTNGLRFVPLDIPVSFSNVIRTKYISPHATKFQLAPCHIPVSIHTTKRFMTSRSLELTLDPPSGKYT